MDERFYILCSAHKYPGNPSLSTYNGKFTSISYTIHSPNVAQYIIKCVLRLLQRYVIEKERETKQFLIMQVEQTNLDKGVYFNGDNIM